MSADLVDVHRRRPCAFTRQKSSSVRSLAVQSVHERPFTSVPPCSAAVAEEAVNHDGGGGTIEVRVAFGGENRDLSTETNLCPQICPQTTLLNGGHKSSREAGPNASLSPIPGAIGTPRARKRRGDVQHIGASHHHSEVFCPRELGQPLSQWPRPPCCEQ